MACPITRRPARPRTTTNARASLAHRVAWEVYAIGRLARRPISTFRVVGLVAPGLSLLNPILAATGAMPIGVIGLETVLALIVLHIVAGLLTIYLLTTQARAQ